MVQFDVTFSFILGSTFAVASSRVLEREGSPLHNRPFLTGLLYMGVIYGPSGALVYHGWPDWEWMYFLNGASLHPALIGVFVASCFVALTAGFLVSYYLIRARKLRWAIGMFVVVGLALIAFLLLNIDRPLHLGSYAEYRSGLATFVFGPGTAETSRFLWTMGLTLLVDILPLLYIYPRLLRANRQVAA